MLLEKCAGGCSSIHTLDLRHAAKQVVRSTKLASADEQEASRQVREGGCSGSQQHDQFQSPIDGNFSAEEGVSSCANESQQLPLCSSGSELVGDTHQGLQDASALCQQASVQGDVSGGLISKAEGDADDAGSGSGSDDSNDSSDSWHGATNTPLDKEARKVCGTCCTWCSVGLICF